MSELTIGAGYVKALFELAVSRGADLAVLTQRSGIDPDALHDRDARILLDDYQELMRAAKEQCDEPALGALLGQASVFSDISIVGLICYAAETMGEAIAQANRFGRLVVEVDGHRPEGRFKFFEENSKVWLVDTRSNANAFPELSESAFAMMVCSTKRDFGVTFAKEVHFTHEGPQDRSSYNTVFNAPIFFGSNRNGLVLTESFEATRISPTGGYVFGIFSHHAEQLVEGLKKSKTTKGAVESLLIPMLHTGDISMETIASLMGVGRQTLYRRLKTEGESFIDLYDDLRHKMALNYLAGEKASINETAYLVGFSDPSTFSRAFKRWTGESPGASRNSAVNATSEP